MIKKWTRKTLALFITGILILTALFNLPMFSKPVGASSTIFTTMQGVRWKQGLSGRDDVETKTPFIPTGTTLSAAVSKVDSIANYSSIDLTPANKLLKAGMTQSEADAWKALQIIEVADFVASVKDYGIDYFLHARITDLPANEFIDDMSKEINELKRRGLDYKIKGVMIGEHDCTTSWNQGLQLAFDIADGINSKTGGWLKAKQLTLHGEGFGARFLGVKDAISAKNFFPTIKQKCAGFSFAFKHFNANFQDPLAPSSGDLQDPSTWKNFYKYDLGLSELKTVLDNNAASYANYTNCIFVGDATDSLYAITINEQEIYHDVATDSIEQVFNGYGWTGYMFSLPFDLRDELFPTDPKRGMWGFSNGSFVEQQALTWYTDYKELMLTPDNGLAGFWRFDESSGSKAYDISGSNLDGTKYTGVNWAGGISKGGLWLDGVNGYVSLPFVINPYGNAFTAAAWVKLGTANASQTILTQDGTNGRGWLYRSESGKLSTYIGNEYLGSNTILNTGTWYHVAVTKSNGTVRLYVNGVLENSAARTIESATGGMLIGKHKNPSAANEEWKGNIDNLRIYNRALGDSEIMALYNNKQ